MTDYPCLIDLEEIETKRIPFLMEAASYFRKRDTGGEDRTHWANVYNGDNCEKIAGEMRACVDEIKRLRALVEEMAGALEGLEEIAKDQWDFDDLDAMASDPACDVEDRDLYLARYKARVVLAAYRAYKEQSKCTKERE